MNGGSDAPFRWEVRLSDKEPWRRYVVWGFAVAAGIAGYAIMGSALMAFFGFAAVMGATAEYWIPVKCRLDEHGAHVRVGLSTTSLDWPSVKRAVLDEEGVKLSPLERSGRMSAFRGVFLRFGGHREEILDAISKYWGQDVRSVAERADGAGDGCPDREGGPGDPKAQA